MASLKYKRFGATVISYLDLTDDLDAHTMLNNNLSNPPVITIPAIPTNLNDNDIFNFQDGPPLSSGDDVRYLDKYWDLPESPAFSYVLNNEIINVPKHTFSYMTQYVEVYASGTFRYHYRNFIPKDLHTPDTYLGFSLIPVYSDIWGADTDRPFEAFKLASSSRCINDYYSYLIKYKADRIDDSGKLLYDYGYGILVSYLPLEAKSYKCITNGRNYDDYRVDLEEMEESGEWIGICGLFWENPIGTFEKVSPYVNYENPKLISNFKTLYFLNRWGFGKGNLAAGVPNTYYMYNAECHINTQWYAEHPDFISYWLSFEQALNRAEFIKEEGGPMIGATDSGMVAIYATPATKGTNKMQDLAKAMWTTDLVSSLKQSLFNTEDAIISMSLLPVNLATAQTTTGDPAIGDEEPVVLNGVTVGGVNMNKVQNQFLRFGWNPVHVTGKYKSYLDHSPYTTASIYLPYSGNYDIDIDEFMDRYMKLVLVIDIFTGDLRYEIYAMDNEDDPQDRWILQYNFTGNITYNIPVTSGGWGEMWSRFTSTVSGALL